MIYFTLHSTWRETIRHSKAENIYSKLYNRNKFYCKTSFSLQIVSSLTDSSGSIVLLSILNLSLSWSGLLSVTISMSTASIGYLLRGPPFSLYQTFGLPSAFDFSSPVFHLFWIFRCIWKYRVCAYISEVCQIKAIELGRKCFLYIFCTPKNAKFDEVLLTILTFNI